MLPSSDAELQWGNGSQRAVIALRPRNLDEVMRSARSQPPGGFHDQEILVALHRGDLAADDYLLAALTEHSTAASSQYPASVNTCGATGRSKARTADGGQSGIFQHSLCGRELRCMACSVTNTACQRIPRLNRLGRGDW